jgi:tRNA dimethylallyltransferase
MLDRHSSPALMRDKGIFATRQLAKRQLTWLRSMPQRHIIACDHQDALAHTMARARTLIETHRTCA